MMYFSMFIFLLSFFLTNGVPIMVAQTNPTCPRGNWFYYAKTNKCLQVFGTGTGDGVSPTTWAKAEEYCSRFDGGHLATLESDDDIMTVVRLTHATGFDAGYSGRVLVGHIYSSVSGWSKSDGTSLIYLKWWISGANEEAFLDGHYPAGTLFTRQKETGYMWVAGAEETFPFVCMASPVSEG